MDAKRKFDNQEAGKDAKIAKIDEKTGKRKSDAETQECGKRSRMEECIAKFVPRIPFGWNLWMSKFIEPKTEYSIVPYVSLEDRVLNKPGHE